MKKKLSKMKNSMNASTLLVQKREYIAATNIAR